MTNQTLTRETAHLPTQAPEGAGAGEAVSLLTLFPAGFVALMLVLATSWDGGFEVRYWAPPALFALVVIAVVCAMGAVVPASAPLRVAVASIWGLAAWLTLSALWSETPGGAWEGGNRALLYAALVSIAVGTVTRRGARVVGLALMAGVGVISALTLLRLHIDGQELFLAGRLDGPVGYRNATATLFSLGFWPFVALAAERRRAHALRGLALSAAVLELGLVFLTQSRGAVLGLAAGAAVAIGLGPDRLRRAWFGLAACAAIAAGSPWLLSAYDAFDGGNGQVTADAIGEAATALTVLTAVGFAAGLVLALLDKGLRTSGTAARRIRALAAGGLAVIAVAVSAAALVAVGNPVAYAGDKVDEFRSLDDTLGTTRFTAAGGQRYDLWRIALREFGDAPLIGAGEDSFRFRYYRERATDRNLTRTHGLGFQLLGDNGLVGAGLFLAFLAAIGVAIGRGWRHAPDGARRLGGALAAGGVAVVAQSLVDWTWHIPGVFGIGLFALALAGVLVGGRTGASRAPLPWWRRACWAAIPALAAASVLMFFLGDFEQRRARAADDSAETRLSAARSAERFNPLAVEPRYLKASALETLGRRANARDSLLDALELEPRNFATLALLGDLEVRAGREAAARRYYRRALRLNPRDVGLRDLARGQFAG